MITTEERKYLINSMKQLLTNYLYDPTDSALDAIVDEWCRKKGGLIEAFKKHPNYLPGKFMIVLDHEFEREIDKDVCDEFSSWIRSIELERREYLPKEILSKLFSYETLDWKTRYFFLNLRCYAERCISEGTAKYLSDAIPKIHAHTGEKMSRVVNRICHYLRYDKADGYNKIYAKFADSLSPKTIKRRTILSLNPLDYLTMSFGNSWASCHTIDKTNIRNTPNSYSGQYSSGTISYMLDGSSMVMYTVDISYDGNEYWSRPKINRQMFHWGEDKLIQSRLYPQDNDGLNSLYIPYRNIVQEIMAKIFNFKNSWILKKGCSTIEDWVATQGTHYADYECFDSCNMSIVKGSNNARRITIGAEPICVVCGHRHETYDNVSCCGGGGLYHCANCGFEVYEHDAILIDGEYYCEDCVSVCSNCGQMHHDVVYVGSIQGYVCRDCLMERFAYCEYCHHYHPKNEINYLDDMGIQICDSCYDDAVAQCERCGENYFIDNLYCFDGKYYDYTCFMKLIEEKEREGN